MSDTTPIITEPVTPPTNYYWSKSTLCFYPANLEATYAAAKTWPVDAVAVADSVFNAYGLTQAPMGQQRAAGSDGMPTWATATGS